LRFTLRVWRQRDVGSRGSLQTHEIDGISPEMSTLDVLDRLNEKLMREGQEPVAFERGCGKGSCGACSIVVDGRPYGAACQQRMSGFRDGATVVVEPFRARAFPVVKDLIVDRSALDNILLSASRVDDRCTGCGACVAACPNASAMLFAAANAPLEGEAHAERDANLLAMVRTHDAAGFGSCSGERVCQEVCPKGIRVERIALLNSEHLRAGLREKGTAPARGGRDSD